MGDVANGNKIIEIYSVCLAGANKEKQIRRINKGDGIISLFLWDIMLPNIRNKKDIHLPVIYDVALMMSFALGRQYGAWLDYTPALDGDLFSDMMDKLAVTESVNGY